MNKLTKFRGSFVLFIVLTMTLCMIMCLVPYSATSHVINAADVYAYPQNDNSYYYKPTKANEYLPNADFAGLAMGEFPNDTLYDSTNSVRYTTNVVGAPTSSGALIPLNNFVITGPSSSDLNIMKGNNSIAYDDIGASDMMWKYIYAYITLPNDLQSLGGRLTISADTGSYYGGSGTAKRFLSAVAGRNTFKGRTSNIASTDLEMNMSTGRTSVAVSSNANKLVETSTQSVSIDIRPGEKYVMVGFVHFIASGGGEQNFGQYIERVKMYYDVPPQYSQLSDSEDSDTAARGYLPNADFSGVSRWAFPYVNDGYIEDSNINYKPLYDPTIIEAQEWQNGSALNMSKFGVTAAKNGDKYGGSGITGKDDEVNARGVYRDENKIFHTFYDASDDGDGDWKYIYGFIRLPDVLPYGGKLTVTADTGSYSSRGDNKRFMAVRTGNNLTTAKSNRYPANAMSTNNSTGASSMVLEHANGINATVQEALSEQKVVVDVMPGDTYASIAFVNFRNNVTDLYYGHKVTNVRVSYVANTEANMPDVESPNIDISTDLNAITIGGKSLEFTVTDKALKSLTFDGNTLDNSGKYTRDLSDSYEHELIAIDDNGNKTTKIFSASNILTADKGVELKILAGDKVNVTITQPSYDNRILDLTNGDIRNGVVTKKYNYGKVASYDITFDMAYDITQIISAKTSPITLNVTINDGTPNKVNYGATYTATADASRLANFIGWYNERGTLVSESPEYSFKVISNTHLNARYIAKDITSGVEVKFINISNGLVDIRRYADDADTIIDAITKHYTETETNLYDFAPKNAHMNFFRWRIVSDDKATTGVRHVTVSPLYSTNDRFIVKINGSEASNPLAKSDETLKAGEFYYNQKINLTGSNSGWAIDNGDGTYEIISSGDTTFHILNNTNFVKVEKIPAEGKQNNVGIDSSRTMVGDVDTLIVSASLDKDIKNVKEMGFIVVANNANYNIDEFVVGNSDNVTKILVGNLSKTNQFLVNLNAMAYTGKINIRAYYIDNDGNEHYSDVINVNVSA